MKIHIYQIKEEAFQGCSVRMKPVASMQAYRSLRDLWKRFPDAPLALSKSKAIYIVV
jgi:hypothetical protein